MNILMRNLAFIALFSFLQKARVNESALVNAFCVKCVYKKAKMILQTLCVNLLCVFI